MARIPTSYDLPTAIMQPGGAAAPQQSTASDQAMTGLGNTLMGIGNKMIQEQNTLDLGNAQSTFMQGKIKLESDLQHDTDYSTINQRYNDQMQKLTAASLDQIGSQSEKSKFSQWANMQTTSGQSQINNLVWGKQRDHAVATTNQLMTDNMNAALSAPDENSRTQLIDATTNSINGLQKAGYVSETDAQTMRQNWGTKYAVGSLQMMTPQQRLSALQSNQGMTQFIPEAQRYTLQKQAAADVLNTRLDNWQLETYTGQTTLDNVNVSTENLLKSQLQVESGNRNYNADGSLVTSPAGAQGMAQVMPATAANPGMGVQPMKDNSPQEQQRFQRDYMGALLNKYSGNQTLALAAYNAGTGTVDSWIKQYGDPRTGAVSNQQFVSSIPISETRSYVYRVMDGAQQGNGISSIINAPEYKMLDQKAQDGIVSRAMQIQDQQKSVYSFSVNQQMTDDMTKAAAGIPVDNPITEEEYVKSMPLMATPEQRQQFYQKWDHYQAVLSLQPATNFMMMNSADKGLAMLQTLKPDPSASDYAFKENLFTKAQQNYAAIIHQRESDPASWLEQNSTPVKNAYQEFQQTPSPQTGANFIQTVMSEKQRLGIKSTDVLPTSMVNGIIANMEVNTQESGAQQLQAIANQYGPYSNQVLSQIQKTGGSALRVVSAINDPDASANIWAIRNTKTEDLRNAAAPTSAARASLDSDWNQQFAGLASTLMLQNGGTAAMSAFNEQGQRLTYYYAGQGKSDPAKLAYNQLSSQYEIHDTWRLNRSIPANQGLNWRNIEDGGAYLVQNLNEADINPNSFYEPDPRLSKEDNAKIALQRIKGAGDFMPWSSSPYQWVTSPDETGLSLTVNGHYVAGADGKPLTFSMAEMDAEGKKHSRVWNSFINVLGSDNTYTAPDPNQVQSMRGYGLPYAGSFELPADMKK